MAVRSRLFRKSVHLNINQANRLEGANKIYGTQILISDETYEFAKEEVIARELDIIRVVGNTERVRIYELVSQKEEVDKKKTTILDKFRIGVNLYREQKWVGAKEYFEKILELDPYDKPSQEYLRRCIEYENSPPPDEWEGVFELRSR
ncbi:MAG: hypothetical protein ACREOW_15580 [Thermodesulfobacteriota bacterium]